MFFTLNSWQLALVLAVILFGATAIGLYRRPLAQPSMRRRCASRSASSRPRS